MSNRDGLLKVGTLIVCGAQEVTNDSTKLAFVLRTVDAFGAYEPAGSICTDRDAFRVGDIVDVYYVRREPEIADRSNLK